MKIDKIHVPFHTIIGWWCVATAVILAVVSISLSQWAKLPTSGPTGTKLLQMEWYGPFKNRTGWKNKKLEIVKAFTIVAIVTGVLSFTLCGSSHISTLGHNNSKHIRLAGIILAWVSGLSFLASVAVFPTIRDVSSHLKWGYMLTCVSSMLMMIGAVIISMPKHMVLPESHYMDTVAMATIAGVTGRPVAEVTHQAQTVQNE